MAKVLICDDSAFMRMMLRKILQDNGHEIIAEGSDGEEAIKLYRELQPEITTMDITMTKMDGIEAVRHICAEDPQALIVMVTAIGQRAVINDALEAGASDFILKPFEPLQVQATINKVLKNYK